MSVSDKDGNGYETPAYPRAQTQTHIRAHLIWYPRVCGCFIPVAIFIRNAQILRLNIMPVTLVVRMGASPVGSSLWWDCYTPEFDPWDRTWVSHRGGTVHLNSYSLIMHSLRLDAFQAHASHAWNHKGATTRPSSTESVDSGDLKKDAV